MFVETCNAHSPFLTAHAARQSLHITWDDSHRSIVSLCQKYSSTHLNVNANFSPALTDLLVTLLGRMSGATMASSVSNLRVSDCVRACNRNLEIDETKFNMLCTRGALRNQATEVTNTKKTRCGHFKKAKEALALTHTFRKTNFMSTESQKQRGALMMCT